jgi:O-antigen ligase
MRQILKKSIYRLLLLFIFLLPWQTRWIYAPAELNGAAWEYGARSLYLTECLLGLIILLAIIFFSTKLKEKKSPPNFNLMIWGLGGLLLAALPLIFAFNFGLAWNKAVYLILGLALALLIFILKPDAKKIGAAFVASSFIQGILAILQFATQKVFASKYLGMSAQDPQTLGVSVIESNGERLLRAYGGLPHPNILAGFLAISLLLIIGLISVEKNLRKQIALTFIFIVNYIAMFLTASRSAAIAFLIGFFVFVLLTRKQKQIDFKPLIFKFLIIIITITAVAGALLPEFMTSRFSTTARLEEKSIDERVTGFNDAWKIFKTNPLVGVGYGNYTLALSQIKPSLPGFLYQPVHNVYFLILTEYGLVGLAILIYLIAGVILLFRKKILALNFQPLTLSFLAALIALLTIGLFDHYLLSFYFGIALTSVVVGSLLMSLRRI